MFQSPESARDQSGSVETVIFSLDALRAVYLQESQTAAMKRSIKLATNRKQ